MTDFINTAESGLADETDVTTANSSAGSAGDGFTVPFLAGGTFKLDTAAARRGTLGYRMSGADGQAARGDAAIGPVAQASVSMFCRVAAYPPVEQTILSIRTSVRQAAFVNLTATGLIRLYDNAGAAIWISSNPVPLNAWFRPYVAAAKGTTITNGTVRGGVFYGAQLETSTPTESGPSATPTARDAGTADFTQVRFGKIGSVNTLAFTGVDDIQWADARSDFIPPPSTGAAPVNSYTLTMVAKINATATSGSPTGQTLTRTSGPTVTITEPTDGEFEVALPNPLATPVVLSLVSTNGTGSDTDPITINPTGGSTTNIIRDDLYWNGTTLA